ncbi:Hypothetical protein GLP15_2644 [Giardia lamblia P15]|uniref:TORTIFOLIA1/SINE1-2 N-terminal domain-containing protein n=1 Tax=Giardia intestinalis (strain P15) TaxID=658858 RepID=E1F7X3_GIAIA|nr:Hypothetical protein GLP15_2644 [Giardia lamblia P15]
MRPISARGLMQAPQTSTRQGASRTRVPGLNRPVSARQGYSRPSSYNNAFQAANVALQKAHSRDLTTQVCLEIEKIISNCTDDCDALDGLVSALTAKQTQTGTRIERTITCQSLCAVASRLGRLGGVMWPKILQYIRKELQLRDVFEVDSHYMSSLAAVCGAYTKHVLEPTDITVLVLLLKELIEKVPPINKAAGIMALSRVVEEMHSRALFDPMEHGIQISEYICQLAQKIKRDPDDQALLQSSLLLYTIVQISPDIISIPPIARKVTTFITDCYKHKNWKIRETSLRILESENLLNSLPPTLVGSIIKVAEECRYDRIEAVRTAARLLLGLLKVEPPKLRPQSAAVTYPQSHKIRPKSTFVKQSLLGRPSNNNTLMSWVDARDKVSITTATPNYGTQINKAYTYIPISPTAAAPPFRQSREPGFTSSSTSSTLTDKTTSDEYSDSCNKSRDLLRLVEKSHLSTDCPCSTTESDHSLKVQTAIYCKKPDSTIESSSH